MKNKAMKMLKAVSFKLMRRDKIAPCYISKEAMGTLAEQESNIDVQNKLDVALVFIDAALLTAVISYSGDDADIYDKNEIYINGDIVLRSIK